MAGLPDQAGHVFEVGSGTTSLGRGLNCDIQLADESISRLHAELVWEGESLVLIHRSRVNRTLVDSEPLPDRIVLTGGEEIQLADRVVLRLLIEDAAADDGAEAPAAEQAPELPASVSPPPPEESPQEQSAPSPIAAAALAFEAEPEAIERTSTHHLRPVSISGPPPDLSEIKLAIIGAGPAGIAAGVRAAECGVEHTLYERSVLANTIVKYQRRKPVMAEPPQLPLQPDLKMKFQEGAREDVLEWWTEAVREAGTRIVEATEVLSIEGEKGAFRISMRGPDGARSVDATHIVLAIGVQGDLRKFGVPGDEQPWVTYQLEDAAAHEDERVVVVGVGDAGIENALALADQGNEVTIVNRREEIDRAKRKNRAALEAKIKSGEINYLPNAEVESFEREVAVFRTTEGAEVRVECDLVIGRLGATPPRAFLERLGIVFPTADRESTPDVSEKYESNVPGLYMVGALVGYPLIKNCMNQGFEVVEHILGTPVKPADEALLEANLRVSGLSPAEMLKRIQDTVPMLAPLTSVQLRTLLFESTIRVEEPGAVVYRRADFDNTFFTVIEGEVELAVLDNSDPTIPDDLRAEHRTRRGAGQFFGEDGLVSGRRRGETVTATERSILIETPRNTMAKLTRSVEDVRKVIDAAYVNSALRVIFPNLAPDVRKRLAYHAETLTHRAGTMIFVEGDEPDGLHLVRRGSVDLTKIYDGVDKRIDSIRAGSTLGEIAVLRPGRRRTASARAGVDCETVRFPTELILSLVESEREIREYLERKEQRFIISDARRQGGGGTMAFIVDQGGKEATDLLMIDETLCVRCDNCEKACAETHGGVSRLNREAGATYMTSGGSALHLPTACQHCENPKCMTDCPPGALNRDPNGEVWIDDATCIGCGNCEAYCPYDVIKMAAVDDDPGPGLLMRLLFPSRPRKKTEAAPAADGDGKKAVKCDLCRELPKKRSGAARAACVASCPTGAIVRIDPDDYVDQIYERQG